jgi:hypothetical protein
MEYIAALNSPGFVIFRNALTPEQVEQARSCINNQEIRYNDMTKFIDDEMLTEVNNKMKGHDWNIQYAKYRVSNNNNSVDASTFHSDIVCLDEWVPSMTCLTYLDNTILEVIPDSHKSKTRLFDIFDAVRLKIGPGDILLFYSTLLHRGIFTEKLPNRRLIQVFDCFANEEVANQHLANMIHVPGTDKFSNWMLWGSRQSVVAPIINIFGYYSFISCPPYKEVAEFVKRCMGGRTVFSSEGRCTRLIPAEDGSPQKSNKYILNNKYEIIDMAESDYDEWYWLFYQKHAFKFSVYIFLILVFICAIVYGMIYGIKNIQNDNIGALK